MFVRRINTSLVLRGVFIKPKVIPDALSSIGFSLANDLFTWNHASHGRARNKVFSISNISRPRRLSRTRNAPWRILVPACEKTTTHMRENSHHRPAACILAELYQSSLDCEYLWLSPWYILHCTVFILLFPEKLTFARILEISRDSEWIIRFHM